MTTPVNDQPRLLLRDLSVGLRFGLSLMILLLLGGVLVSGLYMADHYDNRDGVEGLSMDDLRGAYHGVEKVAPMIAVLEGGHKDQVADANLPVEDRDVLLSWLRGSRIN